MTVRFTASARKQFLDFVRLIARDRPIAAKHFATKAKKTLRRLARFPDSGRHLPEFPDLPHRETIIPPLRFFYKIQDKIVWIVAVWHSAQIPDAPMDRTPQ